MLSPIFADMNWDWNFRKIPIQPRQLVMLMTLILLSFWAQSGFSVDHNHLLFFLSNYSIWILLFPFVSQLSQLIKRPFPIRSFLLGIVVILCIHWTTSNIALYTLRFITGNTVLPGWQDIQAFLLPSLASRLVDLALFVGILSWLHQQKALTTQQVLIAESQALLDRSKLQSLKNQLNPHFLFNALHSIHTLIGQDNEKASELLIKMSQLLRTMLAINEKDEHTLGEELDLVQQYLEIESERFNDRLTVSIEKDEAALPIIIPTMILQPLVENAFKHGLSKMTDKAEIGIRIVLEAKTLKLLVNNDLPIRDEIKTTNGIGLKNLFDRLHTYYQDRVKLDTRINNHQFEASIAIDL